MGFASWISDQVQTFFAEAPIDKDVLFGSYDPARMSAFLPYRTYDEELGLYINDDSYGFTFEIAPLLGVTQQRFDVLRGALTLAVPDEVTVQILQISTPKVGGILKRWGDVRSAQGDAYHAMMRNRVQHLGRAAFKSLSKTSNFMLRNHRVIVSVSMAGKSDREVEVALQEYKETMRAALLQCAGYVKEVKPVDLIRLCSDIMNPTLSIQHCRKDYDETRDINQQIINSDTSFFHYLDRVETYAMRDADPLLGEHKWHESSQEDHLETRVIEVDFFPRKVAFGSMSSLLGDFFINEVRFSSPSMSCLTIFYPKEEQAKAAAEAKAMRARQVAEGPSGRYMPSMQEKAKEWDAAIKAIVAGERPVEVSMWCGVTTLKGQGPVVERNAKNVYASAQFKVGRADQMHLPSMIACLPMTGNDRIGRDAMKLGRFQEQMTDMVTRTAPLFGEFIGTPNPCMILVGRLGQPFFWSPFSSKGRGNMNSTCIGGSGSGKSFFMSDLVMCHTGMGGDTIVIDDGFSFMNLAKTVNGRHYTFSLKDHFCLNVFDMIDVDQIEQDEDYLGERLETAKAVYAQMTLGDKKPTPEETGILMEAVTAVWREHGNDAQTDHIREFLLTYETESQSANTKAMANAMLPYCSNGPYGTIFNGKNTLDLSSHLTVFELSPLEQKKELRSIIVTCLFSLIDSKVTKDRSREDLIVLDEAWKLLGSETVAETLEGWARRLRKYGAGLMLGTQSIADFSTNAGAKAVFLNSEWTVILKSKNAGIQDMEGLEIFPDNYALKCAKDLKVSPGEYSEMMIACEAFYTVGRLAVDPFSQVLYSTTAEQVTWIASLMENRGFSLEEAVAHIASRMGEERVA